MYMNDPVWPESCFGGSSMLDRSLELLLVSKGGPCFLLLVRSKLSSCLRLLLCPNVPMCCMAARAHSISSRCSSCWDVRSLLAGLAKGRALRAFSFRTKATKPKSASFATLPPGVCSSDVSSTFSSLRSLWMTMGMAEWRYASASASWSDHCRACLSVYTVLFGVSICLDTMLFSVPPAMYSCAINMVSCLDSSEEESIKPMPT
mmetsp:Transcript_3900/g.10570  ORF Transcript_3900/g.10570 Transcript_3900/m.10570 type:complete len:204 (-) Transcript_3900:615-1226(-)